MITFINCFDRIYINIIDKLFYYNTKINTHILLYLLRPDLFLEKPCQNISKYNNDKIILGVGPKDYNDHHIAIIPHKYKYEFFLQGCN